MTPHASLAEIVAEIDGARLARPPADGAPFVRDVRHDSRAVEPGDLFVARRGQRDDGARFAFDAVRRGASAVLCDHEIALPPGPALVVAPDPELALALASSLTWGHPSFALDVVGVTGTNGKTTTTWLIEQAMRALDKTTGLIGTVEHRVGDVRWPTQHTTPEADDLARLMAAMRTHGARFLAMEVSSHALALKRVAAVNFRVAVLTNVTQDHLDFHPSLEAYRATKESLFLQHGPSFSVLNIDDACGRGLAPRLREPITYSASGRDAVLRAHNVTASARGLTATVETPDGALALRSPLVGKHSLENLLAALGAMSCLDISFSDALLALEHCVGAPGRLERVRTQSSNDRAPEGARGEPVVLVDYAHTPDALDNILSALRPTVPAGGRLVCVFGCGGDRDAKKRAPMGAAVGRGADIGILTTDNPRSEDPARIASQAEQGLRDAQMPRVLSTDLDHAPRGYVVELDRHTAISLAVTFARENDVVVIAGKGHETYQEVNDVRIAFDDRTEAHAALVTRTGGR